MQFTHLSDFARTRERTVPRWTPPRAVRIAARCILLCAFTFQIYIMWQMERYLLAVQCYPDYELTHKWPDHLLMVTSSITLLITSVCIPVLFRQPHVKKKHVPDPALSILPR